MGKRWSRREVAILIKYYKTATWKQLKRLLPDRSKRSIERKADNEDLSRPDYSTKKGLYFNFGICSKHGRIHRSNIIWTGKRLNIPTCPHNYCRKRLRILPKASRLREKYRVIEPDKRGPVNV